MFINILSVMLLSAGPIQNFANVNSVTDAVFTKYEKTALEASGMIATNSGFGTGTCFEHKGKKIILTAKQIHTLKVYSKSLWRKRILCRLSQWYWTCKNIGRNSKLWY